MAQKNIYVDHNLNGQSLVNATLNRVGIQVVADATARGTLQTTLQGLVETKRILILQNDTKVFYLWDGNGGTGVFESAGGSAAGAMIFRGGLDAAAGVSISGATVIDGTDTYANIQVGNVWVFTTAGTLPANMGSHVVEIGDQLIFRGPVAGTFATNGELTTASAWTVVQNNVGAASTTTLGLVSLATSTEVRDGSSGSPAPTVISSGDIDARRHSPSTFNLVTNTPFAISHNLNTTDVTVVIRDSAGQEIDVLVEHTDVNTVTITSNVALTGVKAYITSW